MRREERMLRNQSVMMTARLTRVIHYVVGAVGKLVIVN